MTDDYREAEALLLQLRARGVGIRRDHATGALRVSGSVTPAERDRLAFRKTAIMNILMSEDADRFPSEKPLATEPSPSLTEPALVRDVETPATSAVPVDAAPVAAGFVDPDPVFAETLKAERAARSTRVTEEMFFDFERQRCGRSPSLDLERRFVPLDRWFRKG